MLLCVGNICWAMADKMEIQQSQRTITGRVMDTGGELLIGVNVIESGTTNGTVTNINGTYTITLNTSSPVLRFTYVGFKDREILVGNQDILDVVLEEDMEALDEIIVVGFGTQKKANLTGAVSSIRQDVFQDRPVQNVAQAMIGASPGLNIEQGSGFLDTEPNINIRGMATIGEGSSGSPLILIDGMPGTLNSINPQTIESVSVLKDAASASIYGSRAAFGVILITTKSGGDTKLTANYNNNFRWNKPIQLPKMADSYSFALYMNDLNPWANDWFNQEHLARIKAYQEGTLKDPIYVDDDGQYNAYYDENGNTDWYSTLFRETAAAQEHTVSLTGGSNDLNVYASLNYMDMGGLSEFNQDSYARLATNLKINTRLWNFLNVTYDTKYTRLDSKRPTYFTDTSDTFFAIARQSWPTFPVYDNHGNLYSSGMTGPKSELLLNGGNSKKKNTNMVQQFKLHAEPIENWEIQSSVNYYETNLRGHEALQKTYAYNSNNERFLPQDTQDSYVWDSSFGSEYLSYDFYTNYSHTLKSGHYFKIMGGLQTEEYKVNEHSATRNGIIVPGIDYIDVTTGLDFFGKDIPPKVTGNANKWTTAGFFGRLNYNYKEKYLLEANLRYDGSSRFRRNNRWTLSPSFSAGYNIAKEKFWEPLLDLISTLKIRGSYGSLANQMTTNWYPTYVIQPIGTTNSWWLMNGKQQNVANAPAIVSTDLTWEKVSTFDVGFDIATFGNRLNTTFDWYQRDTKDMVGAPPSLPRILGVGVPSENNTDLRTNGWEFSVSWQNHLSNDFSYRVALSVSDDYTVITDYNNPNRTLSEYYTGKRIGEIWGLTTIGIAKTNEEMELHLASLPNGGQDAITNGNNYGVMTAGDIMYKDINNDGKISFGDGTKDDPGDLSVIGDWTSRYRFGINLSAAYKGFDFSTFFQGVAKKDYAPTPGSPTYFGVGGDFWSTQVLREHLDYFRDDPDHALGLNLNSHYARPLTYSNQNMHNQTRFIENAAYLRVKNLQLGYTIPVQLTRKLFISNLRIYVSGENLLTFTNLPKMYDPETLYGGFEGSVYPILKTYSLGMSITF